jgi:hypothetical protein
VGSHTILLLTLKTPKEAKTLAQKIVGAILSKTRLTSRRSANPTKDLEKPLPFGLRRLNFLKCRCATRVLRKEKNPLCKR